MSGNICNTVENWQLVVIPLIDVLYHWGHQWMSDASDEQIEKKGSYLEPLWKSADSVPLYICKWETQNLVVGSALHLCRSSDSEF